jgi:hypothetical protein
VKERASEIMPRYIKKDFPVHDIRRFLEPGPIVLVCSAYKNDTKHHDHALMRTLTMHAIVQSTGMGRRDRPCR